MKLSLISVSLLVGFFGDAILQILVAFGVGNWGLKEYFAQHGRVESLFIAGGMMALFYFIYQDVLQLPLNYLYLGIYGIILDLLFRYLMIFPSLKGYYSHLNHFWSAFWGVIPMILPYMIYDLLKF